MGKDPSYVVALIMKDGLCLAASRRNKPGNLGLPGGSIEPTDETAFDALAREVMEETGVIVLAAHHVFSRVDDTDGNVAWCYVVDEWEGEPKNCEPGIDVSWEKPGRLLEEGCSFKDYNKRLFEKIGLHVPNPFDMLVSLSDEEYAKRPQLTAEEWAKSLREGLKAREEAERDTPPVRVTPGLRFR